MPRADLGTATAGSALAKQGGGALGLACAQTRAGQHTRTAPAAPAEAARAVGSTVDRAVGSTVAWTGGTAGLLAFGVLLLTRCA